MTTIHIIPLKSAGPVKLGLTKEEILKTVGIPSDRHPEKAYYQYDNIFFSISYDQNNRVQYIEYSTPTGNKSKVLLNGIDILGHLRTTSLSRSAHSWDLSMTKRKWKCRIATSSLIWSSPFGDLLYQKARRTKKESIS